MSSPSEGRVETPDAGAPQSFAGTPPALPVRVAMRGPDAEPVRRWVEGVLGWQPVDADTAALVPPALTLVDVEGVGQDADGVAERDASTERRGPTVLLLGAGGEPAAAARAASRCVPDGVLGWPGERDRLEATAAAVLAAPRASARTGRTLRVGGAAGGVGTTTVALTLAGLEAWAGSSALAAVRGGGHGRPVVVTAALADPDLWARAVPLPGLPEARVVALADQEAPPEPTDGRLTTLVLDAGVDTDVEVLVARPDAAGVAAVEATTAAAVVVAGDGPVGAHRLAQAAGGRRVVAVPWSARVARAALHGRVPAGLPGSWVRRLAPLVPTAADHRRRREPPFGSERTPPRGQATPRHRRARRGAASWAIRPRTS